MRQTNGGFPAEVKIYFGNTPASDASYETNNTLFHEGFTEGVAVSDTALTGRYIIIQLQSTTNNYVRFTGIQAWNRKAIARDTV